MGVRTKLPSRERKRMPGGRVGLNNGNRVSCPQPPLPQTQSFARLVKTAPARKTQNDRSFALGGIQVARVTHPDDPRGVDSRCMAKARCHEKAQRGLANR